MGGIIGKAPDIRSGIITPNQAVQFSSRLRKIQKALNLQSGNISLGTYDPFTADATLEWWLNIHTSFSGDYVFARKIVNGQWSAAQSRWDVSLNPDGKIYIQTPGVASPTGFLFAWHALNEWFHWAIVRASGVNSFFINGIKVGQTSTTLGTKTDAPLTIGPPSAGGASPKCFIRDVRIWNTARTRQQLLDEALLPRDLSGLQIWLPLDEGSGTTVNDLMGNQNGTIGGGSWDDMSGNNRYISHFWGWTN